MLKEGEEKIVINKLVDDIASQRVLGRWARSNPEAKNDTMYGRRRDAVAQPAIGGRRFTQEELNKSRAAIPRFYDPRTTPAAITARTGDVNCSTLDLDYNLDRVQARSGGLHNHRQVTTSIEGLDRSEQDQLDTNRYMSWIGGQVTDIIVKQYIFSSCFS